MKKCYYLMALLFLFYSNVHAQNPNGQYDILLKGGHVIDAKNKVDALMDVAIKDGKIAVVSADIDPQSAVQVVDARGLYVTPGLIDIHVHFFWGTDLQGQYRNGPNGLQPDGYTFPSGVTTVVDAGSSGWRSFETFKKQTIDRAQTRVLAMLNIVGEGMAGGKFEQNKDDMDPVKTAEVAKQYAEHVVGVKLAHFNGHDWDPTDWSINAGRQANVPIMVDFGSARPYLSLETLFLEKFRPGDIYTHCFGGSSSTSPDGRESIVDVTTNRLKPYVFEARKKGVIFDVGFGGSSFLFAQGQPSIDEGFFPNTISTDIHISSMNNAMKNMNNIMSLFMAMGMPFNDVIAASTWHPAQAIQREDLGNLSVGAEADVAILRVREGEFGYWARDGRIPGDQRLETEMTIRGGRIVYNLNGLVEPISLPRTASR